MTGPESADVWTLLLNIRCDIDRKGSLEIACRASSSQNSLIYQLRVDWRCVPGLWTSVCGVSQRCSRVPKTNVCPITG